MYKKQMKHDKFWNNKFREAFIAFNLVLTLPVASCDQSHFGKPFLFEKFKLVEQTQGFQKLFEGYLFVFVKYFCCRSPKMKAKKFNHCILF